VWVPLQRLCHYRTKQPLRACHTLPMYLAGTKPEHKINNGENIGGAPARTLTVAIPMWYRRSRCDTVVLPLSYRCPTVVLPLLYRSITGCYRCSSRFGSPELYRRTTFRGSVLVRQRNGITSLRTVVQRHDIVSTSATNLTTAGDGRHF
jgi:hypothetical protein